MTAAVHTVVEANQALSRSLLWKLQRSFYEQQGVSAWSRGYVPHYITNNPTIAGAYARVALAYLRDCLAAGLIDPTQPLYIIELGAGTGRFGWHFLHRFLRMLEGSALRGLRVTYLLTDLPAANAEFWLGHPRLQPFFAAGQLDAAVFDPLGSREIHLLHSRRTLTAADFANPPVILANYFFDSIPQDAYTLSGGLISQELVTLSAPQSAPAPDDPALLPHLGVSFRRRMAPPEPYLDENFNHLLRLYAQKIPSGHLLFPIGALRVLRGLSELASGRLLLISADRGYARLAEAARPGEPEFALHSGCVSLEVNFHALGEYARLLGGEAFFTRHRPEGLVLAVLRIGNLRDAAPDVKTAGAETGGAGAAGPAAANSGGVGIGAADFGKSGAGAAGPAAADSGKASTGTAAGATPASAFPETRLAFQEALDDGGPDDFFMLKKALDPHYAEMTFDQILGWLRVSGFDGQIFAAILPALAQMLPTLNEDRQAQLFTALGRVWALAYPIGESFDLPLALGRLFAALAYPHQALECLECSRAMYGADEETIALIERLKEQDWVMELPPEVGVMLN